MFDKKQVKGFCPNCGTPLYTSAAGEKIICPRCDCNVVPSATSPAQATRLQSGTSVGAATVDVPAAINFDSAESALIYLENFFDTYAWSDYCERTAYTLYEIEDVVKRNKCEKGSNAYTWYLDFKALYVPLTKKLEALAEYEKQIAEKFDPEDSVEAFGIFDLYAKIINRLNADREVILKRLESDVKYAGQLKLDADKLAEMSKALDEMRRNFSDTVRAVEKITQIPGYVKAKANIDKAKRDELLETKGIDAEQFYASALAEYSPDKLNNNESLMLFEQIRGYADSVEYIEKINKYFNYHFELFHFMGKHYIFRKEENTDAFAMNPFSPNKNQQPQTVAEVASASVRRVTFALYEVVDGEPGKKPILSGIDQILTCYGTRLYYFKNTGGVYYFDFASMTETGLDRAPITDYLFGGKYYIEFNNTGNVFFFKKKLPVSIEKRGCVATFFKGAPETEQRANNYAVISVNMRENSVKPLIDAMVDVADYYENELFYTFAEEPEKKKKNDSEVQTPQKIKTILMACNVNTGEKRCVLNEGCEIHNVVGGKIIYSRWTPNDYNKSLLVYDLKSETDALIEDNILDYVCVLKNYVYYTVGNDEFRPLMRNNFEGTERIEILEQAEKIIGNRGNWLYIERGSSYNKALFKLRSDGKEQIFLCSQFKCFVKIAEDNVYYLDAWDNLHIVRPDGRDDRIIAEDLDIINGNLDASIIVEEDRIYYVRKEAVEDNKTSKSLYVMDLDGHNVKKLVFNVDNVLNYDQNTLYYSAWQEMRYKVTVPARKKAEERTYHQIYKLKKYFVYDKKSGESTLVLTKNKPHGKTSFKKGCFGGSVDANLIYVEDPVVREFKRRGLAKVGQNSAIAATTLEKMRAVKQSAVSNSAKVTPFSVVLYVLAFLGMALGIVLPQTIFGIVLRIFGLLASGVLALFAFGFFDPYIVGMKRIKISNRKLLGVLYVILTILLIIVVIVIAVNAPWIGSDFKHAVKLTTSSSVSFESAYEDYYVKFIPTDNDTYIFSASRNATLELYDEDHELIERKSRSGMASAGDTYLSCSLKAGDTYYVIICSFNYSETIRVKKAEEGDTREKALLLSDGVSVSVGDTSSSKRKYYKYTPTITGAHKLTGSFNANVNVYDSLTTTNYITTGIDQSVQLIKGKTYYFEVWN
ncbi:MAG: DUF5050 domain-containing protein, partial [Clostridia bacterium]|nr:DUF5050 domain-containing protein [Clostridia bacterium]